MALILSSCGSGKVNERCGDHGVVVGVVVKGSGNGVYKFCKVSPLAIWLVKTLTVEPITHTTGGSGCR